MISTVKLMEAFMFDMKNLCLGLCYSPCEQKYATFMIFTSYYHLTTSTNSVHIVQKAKFHKY